MSAKSCELAVYFVSEAAVPVSVEKYPALLATPDFKPVFVKISKKSGEFLQTYPF